MDTRVDDDDEELTALRKAVIEAETKLWNTVLWKCPGIHQVVQHRDRRPPWCRYCGRTRDGILIEPIVKE